MNHTFSRGLPYQEPGWFPDATREPARLQGIRPAAGEERGIRKQPSCVGDGRSITATGAMSEMRPPKFYM